MSALPISVEKRNRKNLLIEEPTKKKTRRSTSPTFMQDAIQNYPATRQKKVNPRTLEPTDNTLLVDSVPKVYSFLVLPILET